MAREFFGLEVSQLANSSGVEFYSGTTFALQVLCRNEDNLEVPGSTAAAF